MLAKPPTFANRLASHLYYANKEKNHKALWIHSLLKIGLRPSVLVIEKAKERDSVSAERAWIASFRLLGYRLTNLTDGGEGLQGYVWSEATRKKMIAVRSKAAAKCRQTFYSSPHLEARLAHFRSVRCQQARLGIPCSAETKGKISAALKGRRLSAETRTKMSLSRAGKPRPASVSQKMSSYMRRQWADPAYRLRMSNAHRRREVDRPQPKLFFL